MDIYTEEYCPKCGNVTIKVMSTTDIDYVQCDSCDFSTELCDWNKVAGRGK